MYAEIQTQEGISSGAPKTFRVQSDDLNIELISVDRTWFLKIRASCVQSSGDGSRGGMSMKEMHRDLLLHLTPKDIAAIVRTLHKKNLLKVDIKVAQSARAKGA
jgi:hypothetical protein